MYKGQNLQIFNEENVKLPESKKNLTEVPVTRSNRRPLGDICNILLKPDKEQNERLSEKKQYTKDEISTNIVNSELSNRNERSITEDSDSSLSTTYNSTEKLLYLNQRQIKVILSEKLYGVLDYVDDVYDYLTNLEIKNLISEKHLEGLEFTKKMRTILVDWIIEVHAHFQLCQETLELGIYMLDRYSELKRNINKRNAQLIGLVCLFVAAKYEEVEPLEINDITSVSDSAVVSKDIIRVEKSLIKTLEYDLSRPLPVQFVRRYSKIAGATPMEHAYAMYFCDASLLEYSLCSARPSMLASAAVYLALCVSKEVIDYKHWNETLVKYTSYQLKDFYHLLPRISIAVQQCCSGKLEATRKKYAQANKYYVSMMPGAHPSTKGSVLEFFCQ